MPFFNLLQTGATFSPCRKYRYDLWRVWSKIPPLAVIGLNPSTADEKKNDPTVTRCINFAKKWDCGGLIMLNLFAYRATDPKKMKAVKEPVGPDNDEAILIRCNQARLILVAWGQIGSYRNRDLEVLQMLENDRSLCYCLGTTKDGFPRHPLYVAASTTPELYNANSLD